MLNSILAQQLFGENGWRVASVTADAAERVIRVRLEPTRVSAACGECGAVRRHSLDVKNPSRTWRHLDAWAWSTIIEAPLRRVDCGQHGVRVEKVPWARKSARHTHDFETEMLARARDTTIQGVCRQLGVHWTTVMRQVERWVHESAQKRFRRKLRRIGVDEISYGRGQKKYLTVVMDHDAAQVVWIGKGRERATLEAFFEKLGRRRARRLVCVTMDMAQGYIGAVEKHAPQADIVFDRFHIERHLTRAVDEVRKHEFWRRGGRYKDAVKGKKWLLLKKRRRVHWRRRPALDHLLRLNRRLASAYILKEEFDHVWSYRTEVSMAVFIDEWRKKLRWQRLRPLKRFWNMLSDHILGVVAWAKHRMSNARLEGNNSKSRGISQRGHGYRNPDNLMTMLYHCGWK